MSVAENFKKLQQEVELILKKCGRKKNSVTIVAVSKKHPVQRIYEGLQAGIKDFGENRVQEAIKKIEIVKEEINWHFIGTLQKNKIKYIANAFCLIHSVDSISLAEALNKEAEKKNTSFNILMQVNISREPQKHGFSVENAVESAKELDRMNNLYLKGVMGMPPKSEEAEQARPYFKELKMISNKIVEIGINAPEISMGMSGDYHIAIEEGSTIIRVGTAIFGPRNG